MMTEFEEALDDSLDKKTDGFVPVAEKLSVITGRLSYPYILQMAERLMKEFPQKEIRVLPIRNDFFGEMITVSGLLTGQDIIAQCKNVDLGQRLLMPENLLRSGEIVLLDDITTIDIQNSLQVEVDIVKSSGYGFVESILYHNCTK